jgi:hypothetical protein
MNGYVTKYFSYYIHLRQGVNAKTLRNTNSYLSFMPSHVKNCKLPAMIPNS